MTNGTKKKKKNQRKAAQNHAKHAAACTCNFGGKPHAISFSVKNLISTSEWREEHPFAGQNTQQIWHKPLCPGIKPRPAPALLPPLVLNL